MAAPRKPGPAESGLLDDLERAHVRAGGVLVALAVRLARRVDSGKFTASDAQQLRLTVRDILGQPASEASGSLVDEIRQRRERRAGGE